MWFKNIRLYCFTRPFILQSEALEEKLAARAFTPCSKYEKTRFGWVSPLGKQGEMLTHTVGNYIMICGQREDKLLPASVVNDALDERVETLESAQDRKIYRKEKLRLKDDITASLLPRAFSRVEKIYAYLAPRENLLVIDTVSPARAEELLSCLRDSLESLHVAIPKAKRTPGDVMTRWVQSGRASDQFVIDQDCELINPLQDSNQVRCQGQDLSGAELQAHLKAGKRVRRLGVVWKETLSCSLGDDLTIKRLRFEDVIQQRGGDEDQVSEAQRFDQDFALMSLELGGFFKSLFNAFGGITATESESDQAAGAADSAPLVASGGA